MARPMRTSTSPRWLSPPSWSGCRGTWCPATAAELASYIDSVRPELFCTPAATESMAFLLDPPGLDGDIAEIWKDIRDGAVCSLPEWAAQMYGYDRAALTPAR